MLEEDKLLLELGHQHGLSWRGVVSQMKGRSLIACKALCYRHIKPA